MIIYLSSIYLTSIFLSSYFFKSINLHLYCFYIFPSINQCSMYVLYILNVGFFMFLCVFLYIQDDKLVTFETTLKQHVEMNLPFYQRDVC